MGTRGLIDSSNNKKSSFYLCLKQLFAGWPFVLFLHSLWKQIAKKTHKSLQPLWNRDQDLNGKKKVDETVGSSPVLYVLHVKSIMQQRLDSFGLSTASNSKQLVAGQTAVLPA